MSDANKATLGRCLDEAFGKGNLAGEGYVSGQLGRNIG